MLKCDGKRVRLDRDPEDEASAATAATVQARGARRERARRRAMAEQGPSVGRIVHYVLPDGPSKGAHRPAIILVVHGDGAVLTGDCDLQIFLHPYDRWSGPQHALHVTQGSDGAPGTWHWPDHRPSQD